MHSLPTPSSTPTRRQRRRHTLQFKQQAIADAVAPGASVSAVALQFGINANLLRRWIDQHPTDVPAADLTPTTPAFVSLPLPTTPCAPSAAACVRIELQRGATTITLTWPVEATGQCAPLLRELLP